jgi:hypothetical protein
MIAHLRTTNTTRKIIVNVAGFPPHVNLARLQAVRTTFMDLTQLAYHRVESEQLVDTEKSLFQDVDLDLEAERCEIAWMMQW